MTLWYEDNSVSRAVITIFSDSFLSFLVVTAIAQAEPLCLKYV